MSEKTSFKNQNPLPVFVLSIWNTIDVKNARLTLKIIYALSK